MDRRYDSSSRHHEDVEDGERSYPTRNRYSSHHYSAAPPVRDESHTSRNYNQSSSRQWGDDHQTYRRDYRNGYYEDASSEESQQRLPPASQLRLVKITSDVLVEDQKVAIIDGRSEGVSIGRDRSFTARIRCPSMEVSKHHANIFKMSNDKGGRKSKDILFAVADTGSTHGTFILLDSPPALSIDKLPPITAYERLSPPKKASIPKCLRHLSLLRIGKTVFQAHLHAGWTSSCEDCALNENGSNEIPLTLQEKNDDNPGSNGAAHAIKTATTSNATVKITPKQAIQELKSRHLDESETSEPSPSDYVDRAAARRARGGVPANVPASSSPAPTTTSKALAPTKAVVSVPAAKLDATNRGYQMFSSMSGKSGTSNLAAHDSILARGVEGRAGLGSKRLLDVQEMGSRPSGYSAESVRERQRRRFEESR